MKLTVWTYEGPPHVGAMRVATCMKGLHYVLHAPQGDTYADLLFTMIERRNHRPPVTYTTFQARDLGSQDAIENFDPEAIIVGASCTAELIQDDPAGLAETMGLDIPVIPLELPSYSRKENFGADETFYQIVRKLVQPQERTKRITCNILGPTALGFRARDDIEELTGLLSEMGIDVHVVAPYGATPSDIAKLPAAHFNVLLTPETGETACRWLEKTHGQPFTKVVPIGVGATRDFIAEVATITGVTARPDETRLRMPWWSRSVDSTYLTGKRVFIFGDGTCYNREMARPIRALAKEYGLTALISDDYLEVEDAIQAASPEMILGTQMERHIGKRLGIPCAVISAPVHVQDFPARYSPQVGFEGANVIFDTLIHPLVMGLEEHLLTMFRDDFEFHDAAGPSHHGSHSPLPAEGASGGDIETVKEAEGAPDNVIWLSDAERELKKIPFFVRGKARRNTETFALERGLAEISLDTLYEAKAHYAR